MSDQQQTSHDTAAREHDHEHDLDPEPLDIDLEDVIDALPHGEPAVHPGDAEVQAPG